MRRHGVIRYRFEGVEQRLVAKYTCNGCGKKRQKVLKKVYYRNGLHDEDETRHKNWAWLYKKKGEIERDGMLCRACDPEGD